MDPAKVTAELKAEWTNHAPVYADLIIRKDKDDWPSQQVVSAFKKHGSFQAGMAYDAYTAQSRQSYAAKHPTPGLAHLQVLKSWTLLVALGDLLYHLQSYGHTCNSSPLILRPAQTN